jgi:predicted 3-demethylubiquinone-9 3-methyltransferase (glyoxalase superfamily)
MTSAVKMVPHLWFPRDVEEAARFYVSIIPGSSVDRVLTLPPGTAQGPSGPVKVVDFTIAGAQFVAIEAVGHDPFTHAISFILNADTQAEIDRLWEALGEGGSYDGCGWVKDRYGVSWQVKSLLVDQMIGDENREKAARATRAFLSMEKIDLAELKRAFEGASSTLPRAASAAA